MPWWGWMVVGAVLLGIELGLIDTGFYLVFIGLSAMLVGLVTFADPSLSVAGQWLTWGILSALTLVFFRGRVYGKVKARQAPDLKSPLVGKFITIPDDVLPGHRCRVEVHGSSWDARNTSEATLTAGSRAQVEALDGSILLLKAAD